MPNAGGLTDREAAIDALIRFVCALDEGDAELSASSLTEGAILELSFTHLGASTRVITGRGATVKLLMDAVGTALDTTHMATNIRCTVDGNKAELSSSILAQHFRLGGGPGAEFQDYYLFGNLYKCSVVREGDLWRMYKVAIEAAWTQGNPDVTKV
ncbi:hypothetical protein LTR70_008959 [Exophiala xenobiotica]|uniref:SnoaL-like domain-containing protein n=1 Tax=Lithohypha guttulata TaxID=1690604 RepID=A0ABR0JZE4_9EURO|nr:hypothetical protein LTR24_008695 [Lithohypha guttulata]KAK5311196.1 hypothetical protein LTR70_008959 [Exophiala xenobiotica]